jgi:acetyltransferase-like isoleucine patch superfamily enzyme
MKLRQLIQSNRTIYKVLRRLRSRFYHWRYGLHHVHPTSYLSPGSEISRDMVVHEFAFINSGCRIGPNVELGRYSMFGPRVAIVATYHRFDCPGTPVVFSGRPDVPKTVIEADVWVGCGAVIMAGTRIGRGSIVAAGSVVTGDIPPYEIWGGVPARKMRDRFPNIEQRETHDQMLVSPPREGTYVKYVV